MAAKFAPRWYPENGREEKRVDRANVRNRLNNWLELTAATIWSAGHPERRNLIGKRLAGEP
jgi:hypothetical protein